MPNGVSYRQAIVTFVDILGFREIVSSRPVSDVRRIVRLVQHFARPGGQEARDLSDDEVPWTRTFAFSDSIIRIRPFDRNFREGALFSEVISLVHMQADLADVGVFVRGGLTTGNVFFEDNAIFGPAFVRAYDLESQFANVPRVVVDPLVFEELRSNPELRAEHHDLEDEIHYLRHLLSRSDDGIWFVDYLRAIQRELDEPDYYPTFLEHHRDFIIRNSAAVSGHSRALQKYLWLANYHNDVVVGVIDEVNQPNLIITRNEISSFETLPEISRDIDPNH